MFHVKHFILHRAIPVTSDVGYVRGTQELRASHELANWIPAFQTVSSWTRMQEAPMMILYMFHVKHIT